MTWAVANILIFLLPLSLALANPQQVKALRSERAQAEKRLASYRKSVEKEARKLEQARAAHAKTEAADRSGDSKCGTAQCSGPKKCDLENLKKAGAVDGRPLCLALFEGNQETFQGLSARCQSALLGCPRIARKAKLLDQEERFEKIKRTETDAKRQIEEIEAQLKEISNGP